MSVEFETLDGLHFREVLIIDGVKELFVLARPGMAAPVFPEKLFFDGNTWKLFMSKGLITKEEAESFAGKAAYRIDNSVIEQLPQLTPPDPQYFVVGATWESDDKLPLFLKRGTWQNGYARDNQGYNNIFDQIREGDRIAVKRMLGKGSKTMSILALGRITEVDPDGYTLYVKWLVQLRNREVPINGCMGTLHGPYLKDNWSNSVFSI
jgi:hypothetical protein